MKHLVKHDGHWVVVAETGEFAPLEAVLGTSPHVQAAASKTAPKLLVSDSENLPEWPADDDMADGLPEWPED